MDQNVFGLAYFPSNFRLLHFHELPLCMPYTDDVFAMFVYTSVGHMVNMPFFSFVRANKTSDTCSHWAHSIHIVLPG
jgi:hypothetical protein